MKVHPDKIKEPSFSIAPPLREFPLTRVKPLKYTVTPGVILKIPPKFLASIEFPDVERIVIPLSIVITSDSPSALA